MRLVTVLAGDERPISASGSLPGPTLIFGSRSLMASTSGSPTSPTATTTLIAMHRSPAEP
jgi:hypothetical protein